MVTTSKSPKQVLGVAYAVGKSSLRPYSHRFSPRKFTQPQLFACLVLKEFLKLDYRGLSGLLSDSPELCHAIGLKQVPHFTTFQKASRRLLQCHRARRMLRCTVRMAKERHLLKRNCDLAAMDGTGLESHHASTYYVQRCAKGKKTKQKLTYTRFPKMGIVCDCRSHIVLAVVPGRGPGPDIKHFRSALEQSLQSVSIKTLVADAGYDGEPSHQYARNTCHVRSLIPPRIGRPTDKPPTGYWRRQMRARIHLTRYGQRWQVETTYSMLKRLLGSALTARTYWAQCREIFLMVLTLNIMILFVEVFYGAGQEPFSVHVFRERGRIPPKKAPDPFFRSRRRRFTAP